MKCPHCKGAGVTAHHRGLQYLSEDEPAFEGKPCRACKGSGELSGLALDVYRARGGLPPVRMS